MSSVSFLWRAARRFRQPSLALSSLKLVAAHSPRLLVLYRHYPRILYSVLTMIPFPRQSFFHVDCFKCAKCGNQVTADTNLLLLSDGSPICANCSYNCNVCKQPILDEAIMTGDDSYHAHCFKCKVCQNRIDELVFAKTRQGIYCMNCHNERVARSRRHQARKQERAAAQAAANGGRSDSVNGRQGDTWDGQNGRPSNGVRPSNII